MKFLCLLLLVIIGTPAFSQKITYTAPETEDARTLDFEIIGKVSGNYLIYKNLRNRYAVCVYDEDMGLVEKVNLDFLGDRTLNADFIVYPDFVYIIYQYQRRNILYCMAAKIDGRGHKIGEPVELDTTHISIFTDNKIYNMVNSEDKQRLMIFKVQKKNDKLHFASRLFNSQLQLLHSSRITIPFEDRKEVFSDFYLDNEGSLISAKTIRGGNRELISQLFLFIKPALSDNFSENELPLEKNYLDEITVKVDNVNKRYVLNSFYYNQKRGNIDGLYTAIWDRKVNKLYSQLLTQFSDTLRREAKVEGATRFAFNDFFIRNIILKKDGGFIISAEDFNTQSRGNQWNRMDYLYSYPYMSSYDYYLYSRSAWYYYRPRTSNALTRYFYNNIVVMNVDRDGKLVWSNVIRKEQYDDGADNFLSYQIMNAGGELHYLFNELERRNQLIADQSITPDGKLTRNPTLKSQDKGYQFMPRFAKQVSSKQILVPCMYRNYICFAKIDY